MVNNGDEIQANSRGLQATFLGVEKPEVKIDVIYWNNSEIRFLCVRLEQKHKRVRRGKKSLKRKKLNSSQLRDKKISKCVCSRDPVVKLTSGGEHK